MDREPGSCVICSGPLTDGSVNGVCLVCVVRTQRLAGSVADTLRPAGTVGAGARVRPGGERAEPLPPNPPGLVLVRRLGTGGMGTVYLALDAATRRFVAVKMLQAVGDPEARDRFQAEVRALAELNHPHIVTVFAARIHDPAPYYTMEFVPGGTLARFVIEYGPLEPPAAAAAVAAVARAAHAAHGRGIVHRDIKPGNILIADCRSRNAESKPEEEPPAGLPSSIPQSAIRNPQSQWVPKLSDFGLAKRTDRNDGLTTGTGAVGTPGFMAPEQAGEGPVSPRTDVYGLGATLYLALTGRAPFEGADARAVVARVQSAEPNRVRALRPEVPEELEAIVHKCLEKDPGARYDSAAELADDLDRWARGEPVRAKPLTPLRRAVRAVARKKKRLALAALAVLALAAAVAAGAALSRPPDPLKQMRRELADGKEVTLVGATGEPRWHTWVHGPTAFAPAHGRDEACAFLAPDLSMLELCPDPMTDSYRLRAEICQLDVNGRTVNGQLPTGGVYEAGLYFGRQTARGNNGWRAESCLAVRFTEFPHAATPAASLGRLVVTESPAQGPMPATWNLAVAPFAQADALPGPWRVIEVEVTPGGVKAWFGDPGAPPVAFPELTAAVVGRLATERHDALDVFAPDHGVAFPAWNPRGALGVWGFCSSVAVRNVTLTPLK